MNKNKPKICLSINLKSNALLSLPLFVYVTHTRYYFKNSKNERQKNRHQVQNSTKYKPTHTDVSFIITQNTLIKYKTNKFYPHCTQTHTHTHEWWKRHKTFESHTLRGIYIQKTRCDVRTYAYVKWITLDFCDRYRCCPLHTHTHTYTNQKVNYYKYTWKSRRRNKMNALHVK